MIILIVIRLAALTFFHSLVLPNLVRDHTAASTHSATYQGALTTAGNAANQGARAAVPPTVVAVLRWRRS